MRRFRGDRGQALVEFVLIFPLVLFLILFLVEFGFILNTQITVNNSAREAARHASVANLPDGAGGGCDPTSIEGRAVAASSNMLDCTDVTVTYVEANGDASTFSRGDEVVVRVAHAYAFVTPLVDFAAAFSFGVIPSVLTLQACSDARLESLPADQAALTPGLGDCSS